MNKTHLIDLIFAPLCLWYQANRFRQYPNTWGLEEVRATWRLELQRSPSVPENEFVCFVLFCICSVLLFLSSTRMSDEERGCYTPALRLITLSDLQMGLRERLERNIWKGTRWVLHSRFMAAFLKACSLFISWLWTWNFTTFKLRENN